LGRDAETVSRASSELERRVAGVLVTGSVRFADGSTREMPLAELTATLVLSAVPWRAIRSHRGQQHLPGLYWSSTTGGHVVYESRLELARLLLADFDREVVGIAAQPFLVREAGRRHVPDFLLNRVDGSVLVVNVKPADRLGSERVGDALAWAGRVFADRGWEHEVWSGADAQLLANVRFLAGYRREALFEPLTGVEAIPRMDAVLTIAGAEAALKGAGVAAPRTVVLHLLWTGGLARTWVIRCLARLNWGSSRERCLSLRRIADRPWRRGVDSPRAHRRAGDDRRPSRGADAFGVDHASVVLTG
jgi:hypothetical protein